MTKRHLDKFGLFLAAVYIAVSIVLIWTHRGAFEQAQETWQKDIQVVEEQQALIATLASSFGYGGYIHHFKNAVLRGYPSYQPLLETSSQQTELSIISLKKTANDPIAQQHLSTIETTFREYRAKESILADNVDLSVRRLDQLVRVDDSQAIIALNLIRDSINQRYVDASKSLVEKMVLLDRFSLAFYLFALVSWVQLLIILRALARYKEQRLSAEKASAHLNSLIESSPEALLEVDVNGTIVKANPQACAVFHENSLVGRNVDDFVPSALRAKHKQQRGQFLRSKTIRAMSELRDLKALTGTGEEIDVDISLNRFEWMDSSLFILIVRDVTTEKRRQLMESKKSRLESIGHLTAGVAHDFNNILMAIKGNSELIRMGMASDISPIKFLENIDISVDTASALNQKLLAFGRKQTLDIASINCEDIFADLRRLLASTLEVKAEVVFHCEPETWPVLVDRFQLENAIINLCINAQQASSDNGHIHVKAENTILDSSFEDEKGHAISGQFVLVSVSDQGHGIPSSDLDKIFEPYFTTKAASGGSGLGLSMVYGFVNQLGGHIKVYSEQGVGTTVKLFLPANLNEQSIIPEPHKQVANSIEDNLSGRDVTVLIIEDDRFVRDIAVKLFEMKDFTVLPAETETEALAIANKTQQIDLIFSDIVLGDKTVGPDVCEAVRKIHPKVKILYTTGYAPEFVKSTMVGVKARDILTKPYSAESLYKLVFEKLNSK